MSETLTPRSPHQRRDFGEAWPWERVESQIREEWPALAPFVTELRRRGMDRSMFAALGMFGPLYLAMSRTWPYDGDVLRVGVNNGAIRLTYLASGPKPQGFSDEYNWDYSYPPEAAWAAFERFLVRAHWFPEGHPMLGERQ